MNVIDIKNNNTIHKRVLFLKKECNICGKKFRPKSKYELYCEECRENSELLHYCEWLPTFETTKQIA